MRTNNKINAILSVSTILCIVLIWGVGALVVNESLILPSPIEAGSEIMSLMSESEFWLSLLGSLGRSLLSFIISFLIAFGLALIIHLYVRSSAVINTLISFLRAIPTIAVILLLLLWTNSKVAAMVVTILVVLPTIFSMMRVMLNKVDGDIINMCKIYQVSKNNILNKYILPTISPNLFEIIGSALSLNIKLIVAAEVLAGTAISIGNMMSQSKIYFETSRLFALVIIMMTIAIVIELLFNFIAKRKSQKYAIN